MDFDPQPPGSTLTLGPKANPPLEKPPPEPPTPPSKNPPLNPQPPPPPPPLPKLQVQWTGEHGQKHASGQARQETGARASHDH
jgi:hypothetical protein